MSAESANNVVRRVTANLRQADVDRLDFIAAKSGLSPNDALRKALATQAWIDKTLRDGRKIVVEDSKGNLREVVWAT